MLSNGNILFAHQFGVTLITPEKKVIWNYDAPAGYEVHTAMPIGKDRVLFVQNGDPAHVRVVNIVTGATEKEFNIPTKMPPSTHGQIRHARLTANGTLMIAHMDLNKVVEYDFNGKELWSFPATVPWGVTPLANGNVLITDRTSVREVTRNKDSVWTFNPSDVPDYHFASLQQAWRLPNGNTVVNNWVNEWDTTPESRKGTSAGAGINSSETSGVGTEFMDSTCGSWSGHHHSISRSVFSSGRRALRTDSLAIDSDANKTDSKDGPSSSIARASLASKPVLFRGQPRSFVPLINIESYHYPNFPRLTGFSPGWARFQKSMGPPTKNSK